MLLNGSSSNLPPLSAWMLACSRTKAGLISFTAFTVSNILLLLPFYVLVFYLGFQRWQKKGSRMAVSHSDFFTYHMVFIELWSILGSTLSCCGSFANLPKVQLLGIHLITINVWGQLSFHILTCVERYLAVVHPITYLSLRREKGLKIRNISAGCVWVLCSANASILNVPNLFFVLTANTFITVFPLVVVSFCSISVACVLYRPGPGEGEGGVSRQQVDQSKLRAFYTIMAILGVLLVRMVDHLIGFALILSPLIGNDEKCAVWLSEMLFTLPSSLVLPLLFLQRAGKLQCCKIKNESAEASV